MGRSPSRAVATDTGTAGPTCRAAGSAGAGWRVAEVACSPYPTPARRTTAPSHTQRRRPLPGARAIGSMFGSLRRERVRGRPIEGRQRRAVVDHRLDPARLGAGERRLRVGELDDVAGARLVATFGDLEVLPRLLEPLVRDPDALDRLAQVEGRLPYVERDVLARGVLVGLQVLAVGLGLADLGGREAAVGDRQVDRASGAPALLHGVQ